MSPGAGGRRGAPREPLAQVEQHDRDGVRTVEVAGELDLSNLAALRDATSRLSNDALGVVIDLRATTFIDSSAVGLFCELQSSLKRRRQALRLVCVPGSAPHQVLEMMSFDAESLETGDARAASAAIREAVAPHA